MITCLAGYLPYMMTVFTIGHSTHPIEEFIGMLKANGVQRLVDIRTVPRSRYNPQFEQTALVESLPQNGIEYIYMKILGGLRPKAKVSVSPGWRNASFRNFADYMQTEDFEVGVKHLMDYAAEKTTAIMCAEALPWRCHRSLVGDALLAQGVEVLNIMSLTSTVPHKMTPFAQVEGSHVTYPKIAEDD